MLLDEGLSLLMHKVIFYCKSDIAFCKINNTC